MVWHHDRHAKVVSLLVIMHAAIQHNLPSPIGQNAAVFGDEGDEMRLGVVALQMR